MDPKRQLCSILEKACCLLLLRRKKTMKARNIALLLVVSWQFLFHLTASAQLPEKSVHHREQMWLGYFNQTRFTNKLGLWTDIHYRRTDNFAGEPFQLLVRPALTYFLKDNLRINTGYAFVNHFPAKGLETSRPEHRAWQQIWWNQKYVGLPHYSGLGLSNVSTERLPMMSCSTATISTID
jgi:hypothetical protein